MTRRTAVELHVAGYADNAVLFTAKNFVTDEVLGDNLTFDDVFAHADWRVNGTYDPSKVEMQSLDLNQAVNALQRFNVELDALRSEQYSCCDSARYAELTSVNGPVRKMEEMLKVQQFAVRVMIKASTGMWPHALCGML